MKYKITFTLILLTIISGTLFSQTKKVTLYDTNCKAVCEEFYVLKADKTIKDGPYKKTIYEDNCITGIYKNGEKIGIWKYYDNTDKVEVEINYENGDVRYKTRDSLSKEIIYLETSLKPLGDRPLINISSSKIMVKYFSSLIKYPREIEQKGISGTVIISMNINPFGEIVGYNVFSSVEKTLDDEAIRVLKLTPLVFLPKYENGVAVDATFKMSLTYKLPD